MVRGSRFRAAIASQAAGVEHGLQALACLARRGLNMSRIESRPSKRELGEYVFFIDVELSSAEGCPVVLAELLEDLAPYCEHLTQFGAYSSTNAEPGVA